MTGTAGRSDAAVQRAKREGKVLSNGVQSDAIDAGPRRVARKARRSDMPPCAAPDRGGRRASARLNLCFWKIKKGKLSTQS